ncbi:MAG: hypothetical protein SFX18_13320 [Pirellulales bacterium]|nr:hypothetical protein [Pirellulales bacterium]
MPRGKQIGLLSNLNRVKAQERINLGLVDPCDYQQAYHTYLQAFDDEQLAREAQSRAARAYAERATRNTHAPN